MKKTEDNSISVEAETVKNCPILYRMRGRPMSETCMCWGWEFNNGWDNAVQEMSYKLETLNNIFYPKYRIRIQADQMKEKFATLTVYFSVVQDHGRFLTAVLRNIERIINRLDAVDYEYRKVVDVAPYDYDDKTEISLEKYESETSGGMKCSNVEYEKLSDSRYLRITHLRNYGKQHMEPTRMRFLWKTMWSLKRFSWFIDGFPKKSGAAVTTAVSYLYSRADEIINETSRKCETICERCGHQIGTSWSPVCQTSRYITYICEDCAEKLDHDYIKNGELWHGNKRIMTKDQMLIQRTMYELQYCTDDYAYLKIDCLTGCKIIRPDGSKTILGKPVKDDNSPAESVSAEGIYGSDRIRLTFVYHKDMRIYTCTMAKLADDGSVTEQRELKSVKIMKNEDDEQE